MYHLQTWTMCPGKQKMPTQIDIIHKYSCLLRMHKPLLANVTFHLKICVFSK